MTGKSTSIYLPAGLPERMAETQESPARLIERGIEAFWKEHGFKSTEAERLTRKFARDIVAAVERDAQAAEDERRAPPRAPGRKQGSHLPWQSTPTGKRLAAEQDAQAGGDPGESLAS
jgi:hypothetical protein